MRTLLFILVQLVWLPIWAVGLLWLVYKQVWRSKVLGVSLTAVDVINSRWTMDVFGIRKDVAARKLAPVLPNNSTTGLSLLLFPNWLFKKVTGTPYYYPKMPASQEAKVTELAIARTPVFDDILDRRAEKMKQFVMLGAGFDTRAYGMMKDRGLTIFELDQPKMQRFKRKQLARADISTDHVCYIEVNFTDPNWITALLESSYDPSVPTIFLWEGVTAYLTAEEIRAALTAIKANTAPESIIVTDMSGHNALDALRNLAGGLGRVALKLTGEDFRFGLNFITNHQKALEEFVDTTVVTLGEYRFIGGAQKNGPYMVVAEFICGPKKAESLPLAQDQSEERVLELQ